MPTRESIELRCLDSRKEHAAMPGPASISMAITGLGCGVTLRFCRLDGSQTERDGGSMSLADTSENQPGRERTQQWDTMR